MRIRTAAPADERALTEIDAATWSPAVSPAPRPGSGRGIFARFPPADVLVAADGEEVLGSLILGPWLSLPSARHSLEVKGLAVAPARQGEGIGASLLDAAIERARGEGKRRLVLRVLATNRRALGLYGSRGFVVEGTYREAFLLDGAYVDDLAMALDLAGGPTS